MDHDPNGMADLGLGTLKGPSYATLADLMGRHGEFALFLKFGALNMLNLLSLQAELMELEEKLRRQITCDDERSEKDKTKLVWQDFHKLHTATETGRQREIMVEIRDKLKYYNSTLLEVSQVAALAKPHKADRQTLLQWLRGEKPGEGQNFLRDTVLDILIWDKSFESDMVLATNPEGGDDIWSRRISDLLIDCYHRLFGRFDKGPVEGDDMPIKNSGLVDYHRGMRVFTIILITVSASLLPALSTIPLSFEKDFYARIGTMIGFTFAFALVLAVFTEARRIEIFLATAAFAAVEVIFISTT